MIESYLANRKQFVSADGFISDNRNCKSGVPQGSILGPILFNIFVNDIIDAVPNTHITMFADDNLMICSDHNLLELYRNTQYNLNSIVNWYDKNALALNSNKCNYIIFSSAYKKNNIDAIIKTDKLSLYINNNIMDRVNNIKYLGLTVSYNLNWELHINNILKTVNIHLGILSRIRYFLPRRLLKLYYYCNVQSHMQYGIAVWGAAKQTHLAPLITVIKKAARLITFSGYLEHSQPLLNRLGFQTLNNIWIQFVLANFYKIRNNMTHLNCIDGNSFQNVQADNTIVVLRSDVNYTLKTLNFKTNFGKDSYCNSAFSCWNGLPLVIRSNQNLSLNQFKHLVKQHNRQTYRV